MRIDRYSTDNFYRGRRGEKPILIVNHIIEGSYEGAISWFQNPESGVSSHFAVSRDGRIAQFVELTDAAWANGTNNNPHSSIYHGASKLESVRQNLENANRYTVSIEHEGVYQTSHGALTEAQYKATLWLHRHIIEEVKRIYGNAIPIDREHIVGHVDITPIAKPFCPGEKFPFERLIKDLGQTKDGISPWAKEAHEWVKEQGISDGTRPRDYVTRQEAWTMLYRMRNKI